MAPPAATLDDRLKIGSTEKVKTGTGRRGREYKKRGMRHIFYGTGEITSRSISPIRLEIGQTSSPRPDEETCAPDGDKEIHLLLLDIGFVREELSLSIQYYSVK